MQHGSKFIDLKNFFMMCYIFDDELLRIMAKGRVNGGGGGGAKGAGDPTFWKIEKFGFFSNESACPFLH
jgi:hypothetical protein